MKIMTLAVLALCTAASAAPLQSQTPGRTPPQGPGRTAPARPPVAGPGAIVGSVVDAQSNTPIAAASVTVRSAADSSLVAGALAQSNGTFRIDGLQPGSYYLRLTMIGYATHTTPAVAVTQAAPRASVGVIRLEPQAVALEGVEVNAERSMIIAPDRNSYRVKEVAPAATSASEVLESVPSVQVDADGKVSLRGNENVVVQINGRPTPIRGAQLAGYLRQLPANTIERIEVIPNPSAKQDPEGMAGIINIVMKQGVDLGTSAGLTLSASTEERYSVGGNLGHQRGPVALFVSYGFFSDQRQMSGVNDRTRLDPSSAPLHFTEQDLTGDAGLRGHNLTAQADYELGKRNVLSATVNLNRRSLADENLSAYDELSGSREVVDEYDRFRVADFRNWFGDGVLAFKRTIQPQKHDLSAELRYNRADDRELTELWRQSLGQSAGIDVETNDVDALTDQFTAQLDYTRPLSERTKLEAGYKGNARLFDRDFVVMKDSAGDGQWRESDLSNALEFDETVNAVYGVLSHARSKVDLQAGLRFEYASRDFALVDSGHYPHDYTSLFPSGLVSYKPSDKSQLKLSYSRRIRRPFTQELNPFPVFFDLQNVFIGNPRLDPEYTDAIELAFQRSGQLGTLQVTPFYRRTSNIIRVDINTADTVSGREVTSVSFKNLDHSSSWGADLNGQVKLGKLSGLASLNVFKMVTDGGSESSLSSDAVSWSGRLNATFNVTPATALIANYFYRAPMNIERGRFHSFAFANFSVRQKLSQRATVILRVSDPFESQRFRVKVGDDNIIQLTERAFNSRAAFLTFQYNYGQAPKLRQRRQEEQPQSQTGFTNQ
ncbi:MAG: TonB-dependent receptor [Gemmatimonadetes bacterium]|nr:TonB-dependent receptor [Gemmatimonadota bacterium]